MKCELEHCIYNRDDKCILRSIEINSLGMCGECMLASLDKEFLEAEKERQLGELEAGGKGECPK